MCGIVGYSGARNATDILLRGLEKLEYRGYDSAGIALLNDDGISVYKAKGRLSVLEERISRLDLPKARCGIGHTRWATHGEPSDENAHPHLGMSGAIAIVHNGIIENYLELREFLVKHGSVFCSETDTEVVAHLFEYFYRGDMLEAAREVARRLEGSYALGVLCKDRPDEIIAMRRDSPLIIGLGEGENFIASDIPAILEHTRRYMLIDDGEIVRLMPGRVYIYNSELEPVSKETLTATWDVHAAEKGGYEHFMLKEIMEQPAALRDTIHPRLNSGKINLSELKLSDEYLRSLSYIHIIACGSSWHVGMAARRVIESACRVRVDACLASEFRYNDPIVEKDDLCIVISQSGETSDTIAAMREAKRRGAIVLAIVNVVGSSIAREADAVLYTWAGPEIAVATTKAYSTQLALLYLFALRLAELKGTMTKAEQEEFLASISALPETVSHILLDKETLQRNASKFYNAKNVFFIGRGIDYAVALEGSLKLKEISYIHSEACAAGELKHGTISLIEEGTLVIAIATQQHTRAKILSNMKEVKARGATVVAIAAEGCHMFDDVADVTIFVPEAHDYITPSLDIIPLQLFAYYIATLRGCDVDKPRNLAKSVTVE